ncbi:sentrin-specific protease 1-like [Olea europaea subsp. europaea]|uniref:Sentrin-specific protease 1-like n=1 Tax=Olea europaea subsp. europaea TaxID=158383 RepID=A0A8S0S9A2_OLEEU|nr:sentrin-specific protease 1-like [Olea europaea subsp. europaea]
MAMPYLNNVQYQKSIQSNLLSESRRKKKIKQSVGNASTSRKSAILLMDNSMGQPIVSNNDDEFVDPPPRRQDSLPREKSPIDEAPLAAHNSPDESHPHMLQWVDGSTSPDDRSELPVKRVSRPARILQSPFVVGEGKLFKHDDHVIVFEHFKGDVEEVDRSTFMSWFQRGFKPKNKKKFNDEDGKIKPAFIIDSSPVGHKSCFYNLIHIESYLSSMGISKKDSDYHEPDFNELKVYIDNKLSQQTNGHDCGVFVILFTLYILRDGRCSIPHKFDINKCRLGIAALLYKYQEMYVKHAK